MNITTAITVDGTTQTAVTEDNDGDANPAGTRITHLVVDAGPGGGGSTLLGLKGDANDLPDAERYPVVRVDLVVLTVPGPGYAVAATAGGPVDQGPRTIPGRA